MNAVGRLLHMVPELMLLGFATWTLALLVGTIGIYRWGRILTRRQRIGDFRADAREGAAWYQRATRAHANCIENLPVFVVIVFVLRAAGVVGPEIDALCVVVLVARICQSMVHVAFVQTDRIVSIRFSCYSLQAVSFFALIVLAVMR